MKAITDDVHDMLGSSRGPLVMCKVRSQVSSNVVLTLGSAQSDVIIELQHLQGSIPFVIRRTTPECVLLDGFDSSIDLRV